MSHSCQLRLPCAAAALVAAALAPPVCAQGFTPAELSRAGHVLRRMQHGASIWDYGQVLPSSTATQTTNIINYILAKSGATPLPAGTEATNLLGLYPFPVAVGMAVPSAPGFVPQSASTGWAVHELAEANIVRAIWSEDTLREVMTRFWQEHFNTSWHALNGYLQKRLQAEGYANYATLGPQYATYFEWQQNDLFRLNAMGNFRALLEVSAKGPAMMIYLDTVSSQAPEPNQNYARELFELHTMGRISPLPTPLGAVWYPNYSYDDIIAGAAAFSGWTLTNTSVQPAAPNFVFSFLNTTCPNISGHVAACPPGTKTLFNASYVNPLVGVATIPESHTTSSEGDALLDHLANSPATAYFVSKKLYRLFIQDVEPDPFDPLLLSCLTAWGTQPGGNIQAVLHTLLSSNEFLNDTSKRWANERQPIEAAAQTADLFHGIAFNSSSTSAENKARIARVRVLIEEHGGQYLFRYGPPDGFTRGDSALLTTYRVLGATKLRQELYSLFGAFTTAFPSVFFDYLTHLTFIDWFSEASIMNWFHLVGQNNEQSGGDSSLTYMFLLTDMSGAIGNTLLTDFLNNLPVYIQRVTTGLSFLASHPLNNLK